jgi:NDP-sugar pyrophosphorylase family protein
MKAMILAAGFGTRLRPLTDAKPKALIEVAGRPLLEWVLLKLRHSGFESIIINTHHLADQIDSFLKIKHNFGIEIQISHEEKILETGGGMKRAQDFFAGTTEFLVHNVDVLSTLDLANFMNCHRAENNLATLFVQPRESKRALRFNAHNLLEDRWEAEPVENTAAQRLAFNGIHAISTEIFRYFPAEEIFSITDVYLACAANGARIYGFHPGNLYWRDLGRIQTLEAVEQEISRQPDLANRLLNCVC